MSSMSSRTCSWWAHRTEWPHGTAGVQGTVTPSWQDDRVHSPVMSICFLDAFLRWHSEVLNVPSFAPLCTYLKSNSASTGLDHDCWDLMHTVIPKFSCILAMLNLTPWKLSQSASNASFSHHFPGKAPQIWFCGAHLASCTCDFFVQCLCHDFIFTIVLPGPWKCENLTKKNHLNIFSAQNETKLQLLSAGLWSFGGQLPLSKTDFKVSSWWLRSVDRFRTHVASRPRLKRLHVDVGNGTQWRSLWLSCCPTCRMVK